jgi:hypothetical protein
LEFFRQFEPESSTVRRPVPGDTKSPGTGRWEPGYRLETSVYDGSRAAELSFALLARSNIQE